MDKITMNIEEVAEITGLSRGSVIKEIKQGNLLSSRIGSRHLISMDDVESWLEDAKGKQLEPTK